jgi:hypothetical protein
MKQKFCFHCEDGQKDKMKKKCDRTGYIFHSPPNGGGLLRLSKAFSTTLTGRFGMGTVRMCAEGRWKVLTG